MSDELKDYLLVQGREWSDGLGVRIYVKCDVLVPTDDVGYPAQELVMSELAKIQADRDPEVAEAAAQRLADFRAWFTSAGLNPVLVEEIPNGYWPSGASYEKARRSSPWAVVTSELGRITLGWRKRVIELDWSGSLVKGDAPTLFPGWTATKGSKGERYIHADTGHEIITILKVLRVALAR